MREAVYRWFARWLDLPFDDNFSEPPFELEEHKDMLAFFDGLPDGAITQHEDLIRQCIAASKTALETHRPNTPDALAENRRTLGEALCIAIGYDHTTVTYQHNAKTQISHLTCEDGTLIGNRRKVRVPIRTFTPETPSDTSTLLIHSHGINALYSPIIHALLDKGHTVYAIDLFGTGQNIDQENPEEPRGNGRFFNTFNRTDDAERIYDIALALRHMPGGRANIVGFGNAGLWAIIAGAFSERTDLQIVSDIGTFNTTSENDYLNRLPIPGILKAGGLPNAAALIAPNNLLLHNTGDAFDTSWAEAAYALYPEAILTLKNDRLKNDDLIDFL
jgi:pimeloyl-ACP methyl ester carboxylesterase